ncbi:hypothetical protein Sjap_002693 [Stephania japonica]|uniref:Methyltransferase type 12 domain-containing protein n=1 Tax=Stephania japonica TaxID=461633 RepID=A0AAP0PSS4_9MAGN
MVETSLVMRQAGRPNAMELVSSSSSSGEQEETSYYSKDFVWDELREEIEKDPSLAHHLLPFTSTSTSTSSPPSTHSDSCSGSWNSFHRRHSTGKFFKERRYLLKEFPDLLRGLDTLLELGCGNASSVLPILRANPRITIYACDCSDRALEIARDTVRSADPSLLSRFHTFLCDFSRTGLPRDLGGVDFVTLIFTLSAIPSQLMLQAIGECFRVLRPGGVVLFRDYGLFDMTMLRFHPSKRVGFREYVRMDGTRSYFFCLDTVRKLFGDAGFLVVQLEYCCVKSTNRRRGKSMRRVWVHGKFQKPL